MSYAINHQQHIVNYLKQYISGTPQEIADALPKHKRTPTSYATINQALLKLWKQGRVYRPALGIYTSPFRVIEHASLEASRDECTSRIIEVLKPRRYAWTSAQSIFDALGPAGFDRDTICDRLRKLKTRGLVEKNKWNWHLTDIAFSPVFDKAKPAPSPRLTKSNDIVGQSVPANNIHRTPRLFREKIPAAPAAQPKPTEQLTVPTPGRESSIFD